MGLSSPSDGSTRGTYHRGRGWGQAAIAACVVFATTVWLVLRWRPSRVEIRGDSMAPTLLPGDWAIAVAPGKPSRGHVVVVGHPERPDLEMVKRITGGPGDLTPDGSILGPDEFWVEGDNPSRSTDSRQHGPVRLAQLRARVRLVYWPASRRKVLTRSPRARRGA